MGEYRMRKEVKRLKDTIIRINHTTNTASITVKQNRYIKKYMMLAASNPEWHLTALKTDKHQRIVSVTFCFPANRLQFRQPMTGEKLIRARERAANARNHAKKKEG